MARRLLPAIAALLAALLVSGCDPATPPDAGDNGAKQMEPGSEYVAIGDSYTAASLTGVTETESGCKQSESNYPHLVAEELDLDLTDVSCGGATSENVTKPQKTTIGTTRPPQADALSKSTDLVTLSLGGNDEKLYFNLIVNCTYLGGIDPEGQPCTDLDTEEGKRPSKVEAVGKRIQKRLVRAIGAVVDAAPNARIIVVGYPQIFPADRGCDELPLAEGDIALARRINEIMVEAQRGAADETKAEYVDVFDASEGHDMCAEDPWIAGARPTRTDGEAYHPYPEEQELVATLLQQRLS